MIGIASLALGAVQMGVGLYQAANAEDPQQYQETSEMRAARSRAAQMAQSGFTPAEKAAFKQSLAATGNTAFRRGVDLAGGLAGALRAGINAQQLNAQNQFAGQDAQLHRQNIAQSNSLEQGYQGLKNAQVDQQRQVAQQQNASATQSINSGLGNLGSALNLQQALNYQPNMGGGGSNAPMTQTPAYGYSDIPTMTPSGQVAPVGLGNYQIGANSNVQGYQPNMFYNPNTTYNYGLTNPFLGQYGIR